MLGFPRHHTAAAAAALTQPSQMCCCCCKSTQCIAPNALRCPWTHRQTDRLISDYNNYQCHWAVVMLCVDIAELWMHICWCQTGGNDHKSMSSAVSGSKSSVRVQSSSAAGRPRPVSHADWPGQGPLPLWRCWARSHWHLAEDEGNEKQQSRWKTIRRWTNGSRILCAIDDNGRQGFRL